MSVELKKVSWFTKVFEDYFIIEVKFKSGGKQTFHLKRLSKINNTCIKGMSINGYKIEYSSAEPFDYLITKVY